MLGIFVGIHDVLTFDESLRYQGRPDLAACSIADLNAWVEHDMSDYYIFYDQVPNLDTDEYVDPSDLVRALQVSPDIFSGIRVTADQVAQFEEAVTSGYGYWLSNTDADELRFRSVRLGSPV